MNSNGCTGCGPVRQVERVHDSCGPPIGRKLPLLVEPLKRGDVCPCKGNYPHVTEFDRMAI